MRRRAAQEIVVEAHEPPGRFLDIEARLPHAHGTFSPSIPSSQKTTEGLSPASRPLAKGQPHRRGADERLGGHTVDMRQGTPEAWASTKAREAPRDGRGNTKPSKPLSTDATSSVTP